MLVDVGCQYVIIGHSERRHKFKETDAFINEKVHAALKAGSKVILCIGETLDERKANRTESRSGHAARPARSPKSPPSSCKTSSVAYEPVWAIGTGVNATPQQAQEAHAFVRKRVGQLCGDAAAIAHHPVRRQRQARQRRRRCSASRMSMAPWSAARV